MQGAVCLVVGSGTLGKIFPRVIWTIVNGCRRYLRTQNFLAHSDDVIFPIHSLGLGVHARPLLAFRTAFHKIKRIPVALTERFKCGEIDTAIGRHLPAKPYAKKRQDRRENKKNPSCQHKPAYALQSLHCHARYEIGPAHTIEASTEAQRLSCACAPLLLH